MSILSCMTGKTLKEIESDFEGKGYGGFKMAVAETVIGGLKPIQDNFYKIRKDEGYLEGVYKNAAIKASEKAEATLKSVYDKLGFVLK